MPVFEVKNMLERMQLFPLNFYKKAKFNGSMGKMNYRLAKEEKKTDEENSEIGSPLSSISRDACALR